MNIFEQAVRAKTRFNFRGLISVEDLWDLTVTQLDSVFKGLNSQLKEVKTESLLEVKTVSDKTLDMKIEIVKHVVSVKLAEQEARSQAVEKRQKREKLLTLISEKDNEELKGKSAEELRAMLDEI